MARQIRYRSGVVYEVQVSGALGGWQALATRAVDGTWSGNGEVREHIATDGRLCITVCDIVTMADGAERFMRLLIR